MCRWKVFIQKPGPGVYEAAILYSEILEAADRAVIFKSSVKEIAHRHGIIASFMAKWNETLAGLQRTCTSKPLVC